ncbi:TB2/DP1, HVA22 family-domain-containing protein [Crepidotus variabilis]|uniref:Protein YOP1 n=1 Tax=Crepidotus variabilis TaxID=179855 RepID=A0A9P6EF25_9AGAR|nr:TB2/DP1, HVA22 family-domain-containing protein [Crepidotus variabilis]
MFMSTISRLLSAWFAFILPCYATYKALSRRPLAEPDLQKWAMYWSVIGAFVAFEYVAEWLISWLPFYWEVKTVFLLFLSLPQTQGSTYIYLTYFKPFFTRNERELDQGLVALNQNVLAFVQAKLAALWEFVLSASTKQRPQSQGTQSTSSAQNTPMSWLSPDMVRSAWGMLQPGATQSQSPISSPPNSRHNSNSAASVQNQRSPQPSPRMYEDSKTPPAFPVPQHYHEAY